MVLVCKFLVRDMELVQVDDCEPDCLDKSCIKRQILKSSLKVLKFWDFQQKLTQILINIFTPSHYQVNMTSTRFI